MARQVLSIASFTVLEALRNRLLWLVLAIVLGALGLAQFAGALAVTETAQIQSALLGAFLRLAAVFVVTLFVITSLVRESNDKVLELLLSLPLPRAAYYLGKLAGFSLFALVVALAFGVVLLVYVQPGQVLIWTISLAAELLIMAALSLLCLFTFNQVIVALSVVSAFYLLARSIGAIQLMEHGSLVDPNSVYQRTVNAIIDAIAYLLPDLYRFTSSDWLVYHTGTWHSLGPVLLQTAVYLPLLAGAALFDLYRKNL